MKQPNRLSQATRLAEIRRRQAELGKERERQIPRLRLVPKESPTPNDRDGRKPSDDPA